MKDAKGHGSNGAHASGVGAIPRSVGFKVEKQVTSAARTAAGQVDKRVGAYWQKVSTGKRQAVAERIAQHQRVDNPNNLIRVR